MVSKEEVKHIAKLARLDLKDDEVENLQKEFSSILDYIEKLKEIDVEKVKPTTHSVLIENIVRDDNPKPNNPKITEKLLALAPEIKNGFFKIKSIFKQ